MWLNLDCVLFYWEVRVFVAQFKVFKSNRNNNTYGSNHFCTKKREKLGDVWCLAKAIAIYSSKKTEFNSINNDGSRELAYFWLPDN